MLLYVFGWLKRKHLEARGSGGTGIIMASILGSDTRLHGGSFETLSLEVLLDLESWLACLRSMRADFDFGGACGRGRGASFPFSSSVCRPFAPAALKQLSRILLFVRVFCMLS